MLTAAAEAFLEGYLDRSNITREQFFERRIVATCSCEDERCKGFKAAALIDGDLPWGPGPDGVAVVVLRE